MSNNIYSIIVGLIIVLLSVLLLLLSQRKFEKQIEKQCPDLELNNYESMGVTDISIKVIERNIFRGKYIESRKIYELTNNTKKTIESLSGYCNYIQNKRTEKNFAFEDIIPGQSIAIYNQSKFSIDLISKLIDNYEFKLMFTINGQYGNFEEKTTIIKPIKSYYSFLKKQIYLPFGKRLLPYEVTWLKDEIIPKIKSWFEFKSNIYYKILKYIEITFLLLILFFGFYGSINLLYSVIIYFAI